MILKNEIVAILGLQEISFITMTKKGKILPRFATTIFVTIPSFPFLCLFMKSLFISSVLQICGNLDQGKEQILHHLA